ncbi:GNAT family N-acetyltransferase [Streptomyces sp. NPDC058619]|uniref:GNAT family N-acetyltransferase n=1 Tax=unclassified Streptomyces TaxID=2593676 RepID=UPI003666033C
MRSGSGSGTSRPDGPAPRRADPFAGDSRVGFMAAHDFRLSVPGADLPCPGLTFVSVAPTHRRRGVLTALMAGQLRRAAAAGRPLAALWASGAAIYSASAAPPPCHRRDRLHPPARPADRPRPAPAAARRAAPRERRAVPARRRPGRRRVRSGPRRPLALDVRELAACYLGGTRAVELVAAGLVAEHTPGAAAALDAALRTGLLPHTADEF